MDLQTFLFYVIAALTALTAVAVLVSQNIVRSAVWLLFTLAGTSGIFFLLGADFVASTQLIIYVGGILVLVVFGVMLTAQGPFITMKVNAVEWVIASLVGLLLLGVLIMSGLTGFQYSKFEAAAAMTNPQTSMSSARLGVAFLGITQATADKPLTGLPRRSGPPSTPPTRTPMAYLLPFEIVSVHLLVVLIGAAYLARAKRRQGALS
jgi:NADH-quinone oxidoreductase subunit J